MEERCQRCRALQKVIAQLQNERGMGGQAPEKLEETAQKADTLRQELRVLEDRIAELEAADLISRVSELEKASSQAAALGPQADRKNRPELSNMTHEEVVKCFNSLVCFVCAKRFKSKSALSCHTYGNKYCVLEDAFNVKLPIVPEDWI